MQTISQTEGRYQARPGNPPYVVDLLTDKTSSTHITFESAVARSYTLNRFSTGARQ
jgi:hypothetical protein